jgi:hypothetical protein
MKCLGRFIPLVSLACAVWFLSSVPAGAQQSFSCPYGTRASCLDYGDKVCSSYAKCVDASAKCVDQSSTCFSAYTCDYAGFICKSKFDDLVIEYDDLLSRNRTLVSKYNLLLEEYQENIDSYNRLVNQKSDQEDCVSSANTLDNAKLCVW